MKRHGKTPWVRLGALSAALLLAGCAAAVPQPNPAPAPAAPPPVLTEKQFSAASARISNGLADADAALDSAKLAGVTTGPATAIRTAQYQVAKAVKNSAALTVIPSGLQSTVIPTTETWPRVAYAITEQPANLEAQRLTVMVQPTARENYQLWGWVRLFPGTEVPAFPNVDKGTETVTDSTGLISPIDETISHYVDYLNKGKSSTYAADFTADDFATSVFSRRTERTAALKAIKGSYSYAVAQPDGAAATPMALRTVQGGAVVVAQLTATEVSKGPKGSKVIPDDVERALLGNDKTSNSLSVTRTLAVAIYIPATTSKGAVTVLGAENVRTGAKIG